MNKLKLKRIKNDVEKLIVLLESKLNEGVVEPKNLYDAVKGYISNTYAIDQGYGSAASDAEKEIKLQKDFIIKAKGKSYFDAVEEFADNELYLAEYVEDSDDEKNILKKQNSLASKLGFSLNKIRL